MADTAFSSWMCIRSSQQKYGYSVLDAREIDVLRDIFADVCLDAHATPVEMDGEDDHEHLLVEHPLKVAVASLVNSLEGVSSRLLRQQRPDVTGTQTSVYDNRGRWYFLGANFKWQ